MTEINNRFKVKKGLDVLGDTTMTGNLDVTAQITVPTATPTDDSTKVATTAFVKKAINDLINNSPAALDTLNELSTALGNDPNFATTMTNELALKAPLESPSLTGIPIAPTAARGTNTTQLATTAFVADGLSLKANIAYPALTGTPTAPTAAVGTNTTQIATTAYVLANAASVAPLMDGVAAVGTSTRHARQDHVHPSDTTKANLSGAAFTGAVSITGGALTVTNNNIVLTGLNVIANNDSTLYLQSNAAQSIVFRTSGTSEKMRILDAGRVLIGTTADNATDLLQVNGSVSATTFKGSAVLSGTPTAPTAAAGTNNTQIATTAYADTAVANGKANTALSGDTTVAGALATSDYRHIPVPMGGRLNGPATATGAIKITLPVLYDNTMMMFDVSIYEYSTGKMLKMTIGGYNWNSGSPGWLNTSAWTFGESAAKIPSIRWGNDGTKACVWIGETTDTWSYPQVTVNNVRLGYTGPFSAWMGSWSVSVVTTFDTIKVGPYTATKFAGLASPALTGIPTAPTAAVDTNTTQLATTAYVINQAYAKLASPALTGVPTAPTAAAGTNTTQIATTAFVATAVNNLIAAAPGTLDTLDELAAALGDDANFATTVTNNLALKAPLASPALTGTPTAPTAVVDTNTTQLATTAYVVGQGYLKSATAASTYAPLASPALTGAPTTPTAAVTTNTTQIANAAFVHAAMDQTLTKAITGSVVLTDAEATARVIILTGALTANATVTVPSSVGQWIIDNRTTGAFTLTVKMATGTGVNIAQNYRAEIISDGTNVVFAHTDFTDITLRGVPTAPTAAAADNTTQVATTAHVKSAIAASNTVKNDSTSSADPFGLVTVTPSVQLDTTWKDTGVQGNSLTTGTYMVQVLCNDNAFNGGQVNEYHSGVMSWYDAATNSTEADEIVLHAAGAGNSGNAVYLRTLRQTTAQGGVLKLQISGDVAITGPTTYTIKFRRII